MDYADRVLGRSGLGVGPSSKVLLQHAQIKSFFFCRLHARCTLYGKLRIPATRRSTTVAASAPSVGGWALSLRW